jgi:hypothetical protein
MGHAADLPRQLILAGLSSVVPIHLLRYLWAFLMLSIGPLGAYFLAKLVISKEEGSFKNVIGLVAGVFYLLNLATVQYFFTPYESFISFYGFLPWLLLAGLNYLRKVSKKSLLGVVVVSILATPAFYVQTLFVVYIAALSLFCLETVLRQGRQQFKRVAKLALYIFLLNTFWLLPVVYFSISGSGVLEASKINSFATPETQLMNQDAGKITDIAILRGFWFNYMDLAQSGRFDYLLALWRDNLSQFPIRLAGYTLFAASLFGSLSAIFRKRLNWRFSILGLLLISAFMLASNNPPFGFIFSFLADKVPLFGQMFRSVFTKWSGLSALVYALGLALFVDTLVGLLKSYKHAVGSLMAVTLISLCIIPTLPIFEGNLIMRPGRIKIPSEYFRLFEYFDGQPAEARIAYFPIQTFWGWHFYDWGGRGSGFIWYGIKQPVVDRAFDVWSNYNESFYHEISRAVYGQDQEALKNTLSKYDIDYILIDKSIAVPLQDEKILRVEEMENMLRDLGAEAAWEDNFLRVYSWGQDEPGFIHTPDFYAKVGSDNILARQDAIYEKEGLYSIQEGYSGYPFSDMTKEEVSDVTFQDLQKYSLVKLERKITGKGELLIPGLPLGSKYSTLAKITLNGTSLKVSFAANPSLKIGDKKEELQTLPDLVIKTGRSFDSVIVALGDSFARVNQGGESQVQVTFDVGEPIELYLFGPKPTPVSLEQDFLGSKFNTCWTRSGQEGLVETVKGDDFISIKTRDAIGCSALKIGLPGGKLALMNIVLPFRSENGARPHFCVVTEGSTDGCINSDIFYSTPSSSEWTRVERTLLLDGDETYWVELAARPSDQTGEEWRIEYRAPQVEFFPLLDSATFGAVVWQKLLGETSRSVGSEQESLEITVIAPRVDVDLAQAGRITPANCDINNQGSVEKIVKTEFIEYLARGHAALCDFSPLTTTSTREPHLLRVQGANLAGRGLKIYLYNKANQKSELEVLLRGGSFDRSFSVLPWKKLPQESYVLNLETRSFGKDIGQDRIYSVSLYDIPIDWLLGWKAETQDSGPRANPLSLKSSPKRGSFLYRVEASMDGQDNQGSNEGLFMLSQSYQDGWLAFRGREKLRHVKINGWANGWILPSGEVQEIQITVVYWPQYLEFIGLGLLALGVYKAILAKEVDKAEGNILE